MLRMCVSTQGGLRQLLASRDLARSCGKLKRARIDSRNCPVLSIGSPGNDTKSTTQRKNNLKPALAYMHLKSSAVRRLQLMSKLMTVDSKRLSTCKP